LLKLSHKVDNLQGQCWLVLELDRRSDYMPAEYRVIGRDWVLRLVSYPVIHCSLITCLQ